MKGWNLFCLRSEKKLCNIYFIKSDLFASDATYNDDKTLLGSEDACLIHRFLHPGNIFPKDLFSSYLQRYSRVIKRPQNKNTQVCVDGAEESACFVPCQRVCEPVVSDITVLV